MSNANGYSLWLVPRGRLAERAREVISGLALTYGTPSFGPHVTLLGSIEGTSEAVVKTTSMLAQKLGPISVFLDRPGYLAQYFRCLYIGARPDEALMEAHKLSKEMFGMDGTPKFMPHMSLMYGDMEAQAKEEIISGLGRWDASGFTAGKIYLLRTQGAPSQWYGIGEFELKS